MEEKRPVVTEQQYWACVQVLKDEMKPAMGCTEPIAVAYCAALAREALGTLPQRVDVETSGNIIKNVKSVIVPNTNGAKGIPASAAAGIVAGDAGKELEVIACVTPEQCEKIREYVDSTPISVKLLDDGEIFDILVTVYAGNSYAKARISKFHTNVVLVEKDGEVLRRAEPQAEQEETADRSFLSMQLIYDFANTVRIDDVKEILDRQIAYNMAIARQGLESSYGANVGQVLLQSNPQTAAGTTEERVKLLAIARAAAGSDARMSGCELPVVINAGSGNQGITVSVPLITYAEELGIDQERLYRALVLSNLTGNHLKTRIGRLSAYCGAVSAGAAAGCGIAYLKGESYDTIVHTLVNALAITSGMICDGAKASCAGKIALSVQAGILGYEMYQKGQEFMGGDGIITKKGVENVIANVGRLGREGMRETDHEILRMMTEC